MALITGLFLILSPCFAGEPSAPADHPRERTRPLGNSNVSQGVLPHEGMFSSF